MYTHVLQQQFLESFKYVKHLPLAIENTKYHSASNIIILSTLHYY